LELVTMSVKIINGAGAGELGVETTSKAARNILYNAAGQPITRKHNQARDEANDEAFIMGGYNDGNYRHLRTDRTGGQAVALNTSLLTESFEGTVFPAARWAAIAITMTATQTAAAGLLLNSGTITTINTGYLIKSLRPFVKMQRAPLHFKARARIAHVANSVAELGFGDATGANTANANGAYWQYTSGGAVQPVLTYNGVDITGAAVTGLNASNFYTWDVIIDDDEAVFMVQDTSTGLILAERSIKMPATQARLFAVTRLSAIARLYNTASAPASAPQMVVSTVDVVMLDVMANKPWKEQMAESGYGAPYQPVTQVQAAQWVNSAFPASATLSNTAAGYTTLGGLFQFAAVAGAATDYVLFGFQVPSPYAFVLDWIDIETWNTGAAAATTPTLLVWGLGLDQSAVSLATGGIARVGLGAQSFPIGAAIGAKAERISQSFDTPLITNPGRFLTIILRMPVGTATASEVFQGMVNLRGRFE
jgi:hypothetical protein